MWMETRPGNIQNHSLTVSGQPRRSRENQAFSHSANTTVLHNIASSCSRERERRGVSREEREISRGRAEHRRGAVVGGCGTTNNFIHFSLKPGQIPDLLALSVSVAVRLGKEGPNQTPRDPDIVAESPNGGSTLQQGKFGLFKSLTKPL